MSQTKERSQADRSPEMGSADSTSMAACAAVSFEQSHKGNRLSGFQLLSIKDQVLRLWAEGPGSGVVVFRSGQPLLIRSVCGGKAKLGPGWDGTLGCNRYALEVSAEKSGKIVIELQSVSPPTGPVPTTEEELAAFRHRLHNRSSRFPDDVDDFIRWQKSYRNKLACWLMGGDLPQCVPLEAQVRDTQDYRTFTLQRVQYKSQKDRTNVLLLSLPKKAKKVPLLLALHGHEAPWGQADEQAYQVGHDDDFIAYFAERGWAVLQPATMNHTLQHQRWTLQGEWTWDAMVALDYAGTLFEIDMERIVVCGLSTGGHLAMNMLALDDRVKAGVIACILSTWNHLDRRFRIPPHCDCGIGSQLARHLEQCDWAALAAPKQVQFQHGRKDGLFCPEADETLLDLKWNTGIMPGAEYDAMFAEIQRAYRIRGNCGHLQMHFHNGPHRVDNDAAFVWLNTTS